LIKFWDKKKPSRFKTKRWWLTRWSLWSLGSLSQRRLFTGWATVPLRTRNFQNTTGMQRKIPFTSSSFWSSDRSLKAKRKLRENGTWIGSWASLSKLDLMNSAEATTRRWSRATRRSMEFWSTSRTTVTLPRLSAPNRAKPKLSSNQTQSKEYITAMNKVNLDKRIIY